MCRLHSIIHFEVALFINRGLGIKDCYMQVIPKNGGEAHTTDINRQGSSENGYKVCCKLVEDGNMMFII